MRRCCSRTCAGTSGAFAGFAAATGWFLLAVREHLDANGSIAEDHGVETERLDRLRVGFELDESELVLGACDATFDNLAAEGEELTELVDGDE